MHLIEVSNLVSADTDGSELEVPAGGKACHFHAPTPFSAVAQGIFLIPAE